MSAAETVVALEYSRVAAMLSGDVATLARLYADSCVYIHSTGEVDTGRSYLEKLGGGVFGYESIDIDQMMVDIQEPLALATFRMTADLRVGSLRRHAVSRCTTVWRIDGSDGRLLQFQATPLALAQRV